MLDAFTQLVESGMMSEQVRSAVQEAFDTKIQENRDQITAELREEFAQKYDHDKSIIIESMNSMLSERLAAEITEFAEDRRALAETRAKYVEKMKSDTRIMEAFVTKQLANELKEFQTDREKVSENFEKLEQFVVNALAREISEFAQDKRDLAETKVKLVAGAEAKLNEVKAQFIKRAATTVKETVESTLRGEISQLREDIDSARTNSFGRRIFEAYAQEFQHSFLNEKSETAKLLKIINKKNAEITEAQKAHSEALKLAESKDRELRVQQDLAERKAVMSELLAPLGADKKGIMRELLESVETKRLASAFDKYLPAVMENETRKPKTSTILKETTGNRKVKTTEAGTVDNIVDIRKLAGLN
jgi:ribosomal protein S17E